MNKLREIIGDNYVKSIEKKQKRTLLGNSKFFEGNLIKYGYALCALFGGEGKNMTLIILETI